MRVPRQVGLLSSTAILFTCFLTLSRAVIPSTSAQGMSAGHNSSNGVSVGVLTLFHPQQFVVRAVPSHALLLRAGEMTHVLETSSGNESAMVEFANDGIRLVVANERFSASEILVSGRQGDPVDLRLEIPGKITRHYRGMLGIRPIGREMLAVLHLDLETAVASVVAAESLPDTPIEAMKAQAIAARSYLLSGRGRHADFDFCDTTHCQFLREPPEPGSPAAQVTAATTGLVLAYQSQPFPAMYTPSCSGHTLTPAGLGMHATGYPYFSADCRYCREHPVHWSRTLSSGDAGLLRVSDESSRLQTGRRLGWDAVPSNTFVAVKNGDRTLLRGTGRGHGIGLCQSGAKGMALEGASYGEILSHYYPNTTIIGLPPSE